MRVLHVLHELKFSGAEIMYVDAAPFFRSKGCELGVVATAKEMGEYAPYFKKAGFTLYHKPYPHFKDFFKRINYFIRFTRFLKHEQYDVVHIHSNILMWGITLCAWLAGKQSIYTFHNVFSTHFYSYPYHLLIRWIARYIFGCRFQSISDSVYEHELKLFHNKTTKIYNWYGNDRFYPADPVEKRKIREELGIPEDTLVLISVGGCSAIKRHTEIINAMPLILEKNPNCLYLHLGKGSSENDEIELAKKLGVYEHIRFCGNQTDMRKYFVASDIYLMTSKFEGIPITTIEAMACKIPAILYNVPGLRDFNTEDEVCKLISENFKLLSREIQNLCSTPFKAIEFAEKAKKLVDNKFFLLTNANKIYNLYC